MLSCVLRTCIWVSVVRDELSLSALLGWDYIRLAWLTLSVHVVAFSTLVGVPPGCTDADGMRHAENDVHDEELFAQALKGICCKGDNGPLASAIVLLMLAWLTHQMDQVEVDDKDEAGNPRLCVRLKDWKAPELSFSVLVWALVQVL